MNYSGRVVDDPNPPPSRDAIAHLETQLGVALPADYVDFLMNCNGGHVDYEIEIAFEDGSREFLSFSGMYQLVSGGQWETNPFELRHARKIDGFPQEGVLPISRDGGGSQLYLDLRAGCSVVAFVHGLPAWTGRREIDALVKVADNFQDYWRQLCISDDYVQEFIENYDPQYDNADLAAEWLDTGNSGWRDKFRDAWEQHVVNAGRNKNS